MGRISKLRIKNRGRIGIAFILSMLLIIAVALTGCDSAASKENSNATVHRVQAPKRARIKKNPRIRTKTKTRKRIRVRRMRNQVLQAAQVLQVPLPVHHQ